MTKVYFHAIKDVIIQRLEESESTVLIAVAWFTNEEIYNKVIQLLKRKKKVEVSLIILDDFINNGPFGLDFKSFISEGGTLYYSTSENPVHHKFCVIDEKVVLTGSYNWTYYAEYKNYENLVEIADITIADQYKQAFNQITEKLKPIRHLAKYVHYDSNLVDYFGVTEYLANDLVYRGISLNKLELIESAKKLNPTTKFLHKVSALVSQVPVKTQPLITKSQETYNSNPTINSSISKVETQKKPTNKQSLGIDARIDGIDDRFAILIKKGTELPISISQPFYTIYDNQTEITVNTHIGESEQASKNPLLGKILIKDLPPLPAREASIKVTFTLEKNGELKVSVLSTHTGNKLEAIYYGCAE